MSEEREQSPHYIPELDPERSKFDWNWFTDYYYGLAYLATSGLAALLFFSSGERWLGFSISGFGVGMVTLSVWLRLRENRKDAERNRIGDGERGLSPHYIPELDPHNAKHKKGFADPLLWVSVVFSVVSVVGAVIAWLSGMIGPAKFVTAAGAVSFSPLLLIAHDGLFAGGA